MSAVRTAGRRRAAWLLAAFTSIPAEAQEVRVNEVWLRTQTFGRMASAPDGTFWAIWESRDEFCGGSTDLVMRHVHADGRLLSGNVAVPSGCPSLGGGEIAVLSSGEFIAVFREVVGGFPQIVARLFAADGTPSGPDFLVNDPPSGYFLRSPTRALALTSNRFALAWETSALEIHGRVVFPDGTLAPQQVLATAGVESEDVALAPTAVGGVIAAWTHYDGSTRRTIQSRTFDELLQQFPRRSR